MQSKSPTSFRIPKDLAERADHLIPSLRDTEIGSVSRVTRSLVLRLALAKGLELLEQEYAGEEDAVSNG